MIICGKLSRANRANMLSTSPKSCLFIKFSEQLETAVKSSLNKYFGKNEENRQVETKSDTVQKDLCLINVYVSL